MKRLQTVRPRPRCRPTGRRVQKESPARQLAPGSGAPPRHISLMVRRSAACSPACGLCRYPMSRPYGAGPAAATRQSPATTTTVGARPGNYKCSTEPPIPLRLLLTGMEHPQSWTRPREFLREGGERNADRYTHLAPFSRAYATPPTFSRHGNVQCFWRTDVLRLVLPLRRGRDIRGSWKEVVYAPCARYPATLCTCAWI